MERFYGSRFGWGRIGTGALAGRRIWGASLFQYPISKWGGGASAFLCELCEREEISLTEGLARRSRNRMNQNSRKKPKNSLTESQRYRGVLRTTIRPLRLFCARFQNVDPPLSLLDRRPVQPYSKPDGLGETALPSDFLIPGWKRRGNRKMTWHLVPR